MEPAASRLDVAGERPVSMFGSKDFSDEDKNSSDHRPHDHGSWGASVIVSGEGDWIV
jgi:hypothetical protein